jgi:hypothetical protein
VGGPFLCSATAIPPSLPVKALGCRAEQTVKNGRILRPPDRRQPSRGKGGGTLATVFSQARASLCHVIKAIDQFLDRVFLAS